MRRDLTKTWVVYAVININEAVRTTTDKVQALIPDCYTSVSQSLPLPQPPISKSDHPDPGVERRCPTGLVSSLSTPVGSHCDTAEYLYPPSSITASPKVLLSIEDEIQEAEFLILYLPKNVKKWCSWFINPHTHTLGPDKQTGFNVFAYVSR